MGQKYLIDTNIIIDFSENRLPVKAQKFLATIIDSAPYISVINKIELLGFSVVNEVIAEFVDASNLVYLTDEVVSKTIEIRKANRIKLPDAIIAASAIAHNLTLLTRNTEDFKSIPTLSLSNPWNL